MDEPKRPLRWTPLTEEEMLDMLPPRLRLMAKARKAQN